MSRHMPRMSADNKLLRECAKKSAGPMHDKRAPRCGSKNIQLELLQEYEEYLEDERETLELIQRVASIVGVY